jgi:hypothetical protein
MIGVVAGLLLFHNLEKFVLFIIMRTRKVIPRIMTRK